MQLAYQLKGIQIQVRTGLSLRGGMLAAEQALWANTGLGPWAALLREGASLVGRSAYPISAGWETPSPVTKKVGHHHG
jgi:hypothetical protein